MAVAAASVVARRAGLYPRASWYFALAMLITWVGFSRSYFLRLGDVTVWHHLHGASVGAWIGLLIVQPLLYQRGQLGWHRRLGRVSYVLVPLLLLGGLKMMQLMMQSAAAYPPGAVYTLAYIDAYSLIFFALCFGLAIRHARQVQLHARYITLTVLIVLPPALARLLFLVPSFETFDQTLNGSFGLIEAVLLLLLWHDHRTGTHYRPYWLGLLLFGVLHLTLNFAGGWAWWHRLMDAYQQL